MPCYSPLYFKSAALFIKIFPFKSADFPAPQSRGKLGIKEIVPQLILFYDIDKSVKLFIVKHLFQCVICFWYHRAVSRIFHNNSIPYRRVKSFVQQHMYAAHHAVRKLCTVKFVRSYSAFFLDGIIEFLNILRGKRRQRLTSKIRFYLVFN